MSNENFDCALCQGILQNPYECPSCHANFCQIHINQLRQCSSCHRQYLPSQYKRNVVLERMIAEYPFSCTNGCGFKSRNPLELEKHIANCNPSPLKCVLCPYQGNEEMFWAHLVEKHKKQIINQFGASTQTIKLNDGIFQNANSNIFGPQMTSGVFDPQQNYIQTYGNYEKNIQNNNNLNKSVKTPNKDFQFRGKVYDQNVYANVDIHNVNNTHYQGVNRKYNAPINYQAYNSQTVPNLNNGNNAIDYINAPNGKIIKFNNGNLARASTMNLAPGVMTKIPVNKRVMYRRVMSPNNGMALKRIQIL